LHLTHSQSPEALAVLGDTYGLGKRRTLEQYAAASGVDTINQKLSKSCMVKYVPWAEGAKKTVYMEVGRWVQYNGMYVVGAVQWHVVAEHN
jgi:hypothetical protein